MLLLLLCFVEVPVQQASQQKHEKREAAKSFSTFYGSGKKS